MKTVDLIIAIRILRKIIMFISLIIIVQPYFNVIVTF